MLRRRFSRQERRFSKKLTSRTRHYSRWVEGRKISASGFYRAKSEHWSLLSFWSTAATPWVPMSSTRLPRLLHLWSRRFPRVKLDCGSFQTLQIGGLLRPQRQFRKRPSAARTLLTGLWRRTRSPRPTRTDVRPITRES